MDWENVIFISSGRSSSKGKRMYAEIQAAYICRQNSLKPKDPASPHIHSQRVGTIVAKSIPLQDEKGGLWLRERRI
jgi:hypothetical protein